MKLSIVIVNWNVKELLRACLESVFRYAPNAEFEVFVVDNASKDGSVEMVRSQFPNVKLFANAENLGFTKGNNQALKEVEGEFVLLLNPDTEVYEGNLDAAISFMETHPRCGAMGSKMLNTDLSLQSSVRRFPKPWPILLMLLKIPKLFPHLKTIDRYLATDFDYTRTQQVDQVMGAYLITRKQVLDTVGMLDEGFFIWFEEVDFCKRVKDAGWEVWYYAEMSTLHHGGKSFAQQATVGKQWWFFSSAWHYFSKHGLL